MKPTVFVLGAGASHEVSMPLGWQLAKQIAELLDVGFERNGDMYGDGRIHEAMRHTQADINKLLAACWKIRDGIWLAKSIDDFLDTFQSDPCMIRMGKIAITLAILEGEKSSHLFPRGGKSRDSLDINKLDNTWFVEFMRLATPRIKNPTQLLDNVTFVVFNYDRCLEHFLILALAARYDIGKEAAVDIVRKANIWHPYGLVSSLPEIGGIDLRLEFGASVRGDSLAVASPQIRTYSEEMDNAESRQNITQAIAQAKQIVFLGCGFHKQNLELLKPKTPIMATIFATVPESTELRRNFVREEIGAFISSTARAEQRAGIVHVADMKCSKLLTEYGPTIFS